jgi:hypothetical protein
MASVLTLASDVGCAHSPGKVATSSSAKLQVGGSAVLLKDGIDGKGISGCGTVPSKDSNGVDVNLQCTKVDSVSSGEASKLNADGKPVMLDTLAGNTDGTVNYVKPVAGLQGAAKQTFLTAS